MCTAVHWTWDRERDCVCVRVCMRGRASAHLNVYTVHYTNPKHGNDDDDAVDDDDDGDEMRMFRRIAFYNLSNYYQNDENNEMGIDEYENKWTNEALKWQNEQIHEMKHEMMATMIFLTFS